MTRSTTYTDRLEVAVSAEEAWQALEEMAQWLPALSTVRSLEPEPGVGPGPVVVLSNGHHYQVRTPEGPTMHCVIAEADRDQGIVRIHAHLGPLRSRLRCSITASSRASCVIERQQSYPGLIGRLFTKIFGHREADETTAYLRAWADHAMASRRDADTTRHARPALTNQEHDLED